MDPSGTASAVRRVGAGTMHYYPSTGFPGAGYSHCRSGSDSGLHRRGRTGRWRPSTAGIPPSPIWKGLANFSVNRIDN
ncbi:hypothetical protein NQ318_004893 [Aromia moschata]|uniref:Uncharacterized protein n=1 Tax=Aromia moschata TaxID=1265417 RepID=A0AAV8YZF4_9CUCU|nr:hypothetical protein NQ318_004893 [Aromia moschata]